MQRREKQLLAVVVVLFALMGGKWAYDGISHALASRRGAIEKLAGDLQKSRLKVLAGQQAQKRLADWEKRSLPSDPQLAHGSYSAWLRGVVEQAGISRANVDPNQPAQRQGVYQLRRYTVNGVANLEQVVKFLHGFYTAGHLHQIRMLKLSPQEKGQLELHATIEALVLPGADRKDKLTELPGVYLAGRGLDSYHDALKKRGYFSPYSPPPPTPPSGRDAPPEPPFDSLKFVKLTGVISEGGPPRVWLVVQTTGERFDLGEGDEFKVGDDCRGKVQRILQRSAELVVNDKAIHVTLGDSLRDGKPIATAAASETTTASAL